MLCGVKPHNILRRRSDSAPEIAQVADTFFCVEKLSKQSAQLSHFAFHRLGRRCIPCDLHAAIGTLVRSSYSFLLSQ